MTAPTPPGPIDLLLEHRAWLRGLAHQLVRDPGQADDLEQQTWLAALERAPARLDTPRAWLATVLRSRIARGHRTTSRRVARERATARPEATASTADVVAHGELLRHVTNAVMDLDEPYRTTVLLRFIEQLPPHDLAERMGVPVETVRTRVKRALARLREQLDANHDGSRRAWCVPLVAAATGLPAPPITAAAGLTGGVAVTVKTKIAVGVLAALLLLAVGIVWSVGADADPGRRTASGTAVDEVATPIDPGRRDRTRLAAGWRDASEIEESTTDVAEDVAESGRQVRGHITGFETDGRSGSITVRTIVEFEAVPGEASGTLSPDGSFEFTAGDLLQAELLGADQGVIEWEVEVDHPGYIPARARVQVGDVRSGDGLELGAVTPALTPAVELAGTVLDAAGDPMTGAAISAFRVAGGDAARLPIDRAVSGADGAFVIRVAHSGKHVVAATRAGLRPAGIVLTASANSAGALAPLTLDEGHAFEGVAYGPDGAPFAGATVAVHRGAAVVLQPDTDEDPLLTIVGDGVEHARLRTEADEDGRFRVSGLGDGLHRVGVTAAPGIHVLPSALNVSEVERTAPDARVELSVRGGRIRLRGVFGDDPVLGASLFAVEHSTGTALGPVDVDAQGEVEFLAAPGSQILGWFQHRDFEADQLSVQAPAEGETIVREMTARPRVVEAEPEIPVTALLRTPDGGEVSAAQFGLVELPRTGARMVPWQAADQHEESYRVIAKKPGRYLLIVRANARNWYTRAGHYLDATTEIEVPENGSLRVTIDLVLGARIRVAARGPDGALLHADVDLRNSDDEPVSGVLSVFRSDGVASSNANGLLSGTMGMNGTVPNDLVQAIPAGRYRVTFSHEGYRPRTKEIVLTAGETTTVDVALEPLTAR